MSGRRMDDRSFWAGKGSEASPFPMGNKTKSESSAEMGGGMGEYQDTTEAIRKQQDMTTQKLKSHPLKTGYRK